MQHQLQGLVVVVTGASAGIGRATALRFAGEGANVVVSSRRAEALGSLARECEACGGAALAVPADVTEERQVEELARRAVERFGHIDVWVNNAGVSAFGRFEELPPDVFRRVMDTNFFGMVHGARAALKRFREQGHGTLINVSSVVGALGQPYTSAYVSSKWAIRGFSESLREELSLDGAKDIHVCTVLPAAIDTPLFHTAANYSGRAVKPMAPVYDPSVVAGAIISLARRPRREVYAGGIGRLAAAQHTLTPAIFEPIFARQVDRGHFQARAQEATAGNLFEPPQGWTTVTGGWRNGSIGGSTRLDRGVGIGALAVLAGAGALAWFGLRRRRKRRRPYEVAMNALKRAGERLPIGR